MKKLFWGKILLLLLLIQSCSTVDSDVLTVDLYNLAVEYHKLGNYDRAQFYYNKSLAQEESPLDAQYNLALLYVQHSQFYLADNLIKRLERKDPLNREVLRLRLYLEASLLEGDPLLATEKILDLYPRDLYALQTSAEILLDTDKPEIARGRLELIPQEQRDQIFVELMQRVVQWDAQPIILSIGQPTYSGYEMLYSGKYRYEYLFEAQGDSDESIDILEQEELQAIRDGEEAALLWPFRDKEWFDQEMLLRLYLLLDKTEEWEKQQVLLDLWEVRFPEDLPLVYFYRASLELQHLNLWEEGLTNLRRALSQGYADWGSVNRLSGEVGDELEKEVEYLEELYHWE